MKTSVTGISLIKEFEGCRLTAYQCAAGVWTIGYGHTKNVVSGMTISQPEAESFLRDDLIIYETYVNGLLSHYPLNQNQFDALVSFTYNCGYGNLINLTKTNTRTLGQISESMLNYTKAAGITLPGLIRRRLAEVSLFNSSVTVDSIIDSEYYPSYTGVNKHLDDIMAAIGAINDYDITKEHLYEQRFPIARANGHLQYKGTYEQNMDLIGKAKEGKLRRAR